MRDSGVAGAGGAGFPSYAKLDKRADTIILNCAECEPLLKLHRQVLEKYALEIMTALDVIAKAVEAMFGVKVDKVNTITMKKKPKRLGVHFGYTSEWKKAIVTLTADSKTIEFFDGLN